MNSRLITQVADTSLQVALIGDASPLVEKIAGYCQRQDFQVHRFELSQAATLKTATEKTEWYKVIVVIEVTPDIKKSAWEAAVTQWHTVPEKQRLAVVTFPALIDSAMPEYETWTTASQTTLAVLNQLASVPATIFLGQDVVVGDTWLPLQAMKSEQSPGKLFNPTLALTPQSFEDFWARIKPHLFAPRSQVVLCQGLSHHSDTLLAEYQRQRRVLTRHEATIVTLPAVGAPLPLTVTQTLTTTSPLPDVLRPLVTPPARSAPHPTSLPKPNLRSPTPLVVSRQPAPQPTAKTAQKPPSSRTPTTPHVPAENARATDQELVEKVHAVFSEQRSHEKLDSVKTIASAKLKASGKKKHRQWLFATACAFVGLAGLMVALTITYFVSAFFLRQNIWAALAPFEQENPTPSPVSRTLVRQSASLIRQTTLYSSVVPSPFLGTVPTWTEIGQKLVLVHGEYDTFALALGEQIVAVVNPTRVILPSPLTLTERAQTTGTLLALLEQVEQTSLSAPKLALLKRYKNWLQNYAQELTAYQRLQPVLSPIVGSEQRRKYAVVFQNDQELRPTGGYIQSVSLVTFANGQLIDVQTYGVYTLDNQLKAQVTPPTEVAQLLGEESWFLRDSNWNPDFPKAAENMKWFIEHETNQQLDGVVTLTSAALAAILSAVGPVELPEYNEVITDRNLTERLEFHSEVQLTNQADAKEYTEVLVQRVWQKLQELTPEKGQQFAVALQTQLKQKNMLLYLKDSGEQSTIQALGWSGKLLAPDCPSQLASARTCVVDTLAVVDANIGVNKANYHLKRSENHEIALGETQATHTHTLTFNNTSQSNAWPQGTYSAYTRFYLPATAEVKSITRNGQAVSPDALFASQYDVFSVVGVVSQTPIQQQTTLELVYTTPLPSNRSWAYAFFYQKQAGVPLALSTVNLTHSPTLTPKLIAPQAQVQLGRITFTELDDDHQFVGVSF